MTGMILFGGYQFNLLTWDLKVFLMNLLYVFLFEFVLFWNGIIRIYLYSKQIGIKWKVIGILCGMIQAVRILSSKLIGNKIIFIINLIIYSFSLSKIFFVSPHTISIQT